MSYQPNFNDPRVKSRIKTALGFTAGCFSTTKPRAWSSRYITKFLGQQQHPLGSWLRQQLLIVTKQSYSKDQGTCKEYILNQQGIEFVRACLNDPQPIQTLVKSYARDEFKQELKTKEFKYLDKSSRLWHPLQNVRSQHRKSILAEHGLKYQYDIECCAPTLILQHSQRLGNDEYLFALNKYIHNKEQVRTEIAREAELPIEAVKIIINALLNGARLGHNPETEIYKILEGDNARIEFLKQHEFLTELRSDIKTCWSYISEYLPRRSVRTKKGTQRLLPISSKQKWSVYFDLERQVLNSVRTYLDQTDNRYFLEHDGWTSVNQVDKFELINRVYSDTNFNVKFIEKFIENDDY